MQQTVTLKVNGVDKTISTEPGRKLLDVLREDLHLTGAKYGCGEGQCRACLVLIDGRPSTSCLLSVGSLDNRSITTIEGLANGPTLHPVQEAFLQEGAMQCGYCTSGMILSAVALLRMHPNPSEEDIVKGMNGNLCRCNGYVKILDAVRNSSRKIREQGHE
jgi:aerobic-type carbon monoxide dehydrogenase small subunit (CoxS/CutS family)